jgi:hypothetical protein
MRPAPLVVLFSSLVVSSFAQQAMDPDFAASVKQWTTKPEFLSPLVDHLPKSVSGGVPSPKDVLGYHVGTPKKLTHYSKIIGYMKALEKTSPRVKLLEVGKTEEGRTCVTVVIADADTIRNLDTYKGHLAKLADPRGLTEAQAREVIGKAKPIYHITGGLHASETGSPEMLMELAYRLAVEEGPMYDQIRKNLIVFLTPALEPDGQERYTDWYYRHKIAEEGEEDRMPGPPYWGKYIFHDNNRDINYSQQTLRNWIQAYLDWHPPIIHDLHESVPFLYTFSGQTPHNPNLDPILYTELPWFAHYELSKMVSYGMPGVWTHAFVDMWSVGYLGFMASNHNGMLRMYETFGNGGANTMKRKVETPGGGDRFNASRRDWFRPLPAYKEVEWSLRNNTNFMQTGVLSALELASNNHAMILENFYKKSRNSVEAGKKEAPYGWTIPAAGHKDQVRVAFVVNTLRTQGIEVGRRADGTFVIRRDQPYGRLAKSLLEKQVFPDPNQRTYDDTGWTMGLMAGVTVTEVKDRAELDAQPAPLIASYQPKGVVEGSASAKWIAVPNHGSNAMVTLRYRLKDVPVEALSKAAGDLPAGTFVLPASAQARTEIESLGLTAKAVAEKPANDNLHAVDLPRLAMFSMWGSTQEVGWVRHAFDHFGLQYDLIFKERIRKGNLRRDYDVILMPNQGFGGKSIVNDLDCQGRKLSYTKSAEQQSLGLYGESEDICGGMGLAGALEIEKFVQEGGRLITLGRASLFPTELGMTRRVDAGRPSPTFYAPGPIVEAEIVKREHPVFYGYADKTAPVRYANGPLLNVPEADKKKVVLMQFVGTDKSILSGSMNRPAEVKDKAAIVDVASGSGRILMFATNPCYRWQNHAEFPMLFNSILHWNDWN